VAAIDADGLVAHRDVATIADDGYITIIGPSRK